MRFFLLLLLTLFQLALSPFCPPLAVLRRNGWGVFHTILSIGIIVAGPIWLAKQLDPKTVSDMGASAAGYLGSHAIGTEFLGGLACGWVLAALYAGLVNVARFVSLIRYPAQAAVTSIGDTMDGFKESAKQFGNLAKTGGETGRSFREKAERFEKLIKGR